MNTKGIKFLAVLAVLAMAFAVFAVVSDSQDNDAGDSTAKIGYQTYDTLADAVAAAKNNDTIVMINDETLETVVIENKTITLDLNGKTISGNDQRAIWIKSGSLDIVGAGIVQANHASSLKDSSSVIRVGDGNSYEQKAGVNASLTIGQNVKVLSDYCYCVTAFGADTVENVVVNGELKTTGAACAIGGNGNDKYTASTITIGSTAKLESTNDTAVYIPNKGTINISGIIKGKSGIEMKGGNAIILSDGATIEATYASEPTHTKNGNGTSTTGYAIALVENAGYVGSPTITIPEGTTVIGPVALVADDKLTANGGSITIAGGIIKGAISKVKTEDGDDPLGTIKVTGGSFSDLSVLPFVQSDKSINFIGTKVLSNAAPATVASKVTLNIASGGSIDVGAKSEAEPPVYALVNNGTINVLKGGALTGYGNIDNKGKIQFDEKDVTPKEITSDTPAAVTDEIIADLSGASTEAVIEFPAAVEAVSDAKPIDIGSKEVAFVGKSQDITGFNITVATGTTSAGSISFSGFNKVSGQVTLGSGTSAQTIALSEVKGNFTISKGSIVIDGTEYSGSVTITGGTELKLSGTVAAAGFTVKYDTTSTGTAKVIIEEGKGLELKGVFTIDSDKIALQIDGKLFASGGSISSKGNITVNDGGEIASAIDDAGKITITANSGSKVSGVITLDHAVSTVLDSTFIAYSGSDINGVTSAQKTQFSGKDAAGGKWSFAGGELLLDNYNGTYNFKMFGDNVTSINLVGENTVAYTAPSTYAGATLFGAQVEKISTVQGSATLTIEANLSAVTGDNLACDFYAVRHSDGAIDINAVAVTINVTGYNSDWTDAQIRAGHFIGISAQGLKLYNAVLGLNVMAAYAADNGVGIDITNDKDLEIISCSNVSILSSGYGAVVTGKFTVKDTSVILNGQIEGLYVKGATEISNYATVTVTNEFEAVGNVSISQESSLNVDDLELYGIMTNNGNVVLTGNSIIHDAAIVNNNASIINSGLIGVYGTINNKTGGYFDNSGSVIGYQYKLPAADLSLTFADETVAEATQASLKEIKLAKEKMELNADGTFTIFDASVKLKTKGGATDYIAGFAGTLAYDNSDAGSYTLILANDGASISVTYKYTTVAADKIIGKAYSVALSGSISDYTLVTNVSTGAITEMVAPTPTTGAFCVQDGTFDNEEGIVALYKAATPVAEDGTFIGSYVTTVDTTMAGKMTGVIYSEGGVTITGMLEGDIYSKGAVSIASPSSTAIAKVTGNVTMNNSKEDKDFTLNGAMDGTLKYVTEYNTVTSGTPVMQAFTATLTIKGTEKNSGDGMVITATKGKDATTTTAAVGGCFVLSKAAALATGKTVKMTLTEGKFAAPKSVTLPVSYELIIEDDTTIEVAKTATFTIEGGLKVADGAQRNYELVTIPVTYGKLAYVMMFDIAEGYTVFSNVEYALSNCDENSDLTVGSKTTVNANVAIKAGVKVYVDNVELGIDAFDLSMGEGAQIILLGNAKVTFAATGSKTTAGVETLYTVNGTIVYEEDNIITFSKVRFDAASSVVAVAATSTSDEKLGLDLHLNDGVVVLESGLANGAVDLNNLRFDLNGTATKVSGKYTVALGATSEAAVTDAAEVTTKGSEIPATVVVVNGTMKVNANMDITGTYAGLGSIVLADGKVVSVADKAVVAATIGNGEDEFGLITDAGAYTITSVAKTTSVPAYVKVDGALNNGAITAVGNTAVGTLVLGYTEATATEEAKIGAVNVPEGATLTVLTKLTANGAVGNAGTLNYKTDDTPTYGTLEYQITYVDDSYTIYTMLNTALDIVEPGTEIVIEDNLKVADNKTIPLGVSIVIASGHYLTVEANKYLIIGADDSELGASATLSGAVVLEDGAYVIDFEGSGSEIGVYTDTALTKAAAYNMFLVDDLVFATVFAYSSDKVLELTPAAGQIDLNLLIPVVEGYYFDQWTLQNGVTPADGQKLSAGPFTANMIASKVSVIFSTVAGINYYVDGEIVNTLDAPVKVMYGATVTAKISDTSKYQGTPLVNGKAYILIDNDVSKVTGSGVNPIPVPPEPEPEPVVGDSGLSLTDILLIVLVILIAIMVVILVLRLNRS